MVQTSSPHRMASLWSMGSTFIQFSCHTCLKFVPRPFRFVGTNAYWLPTLHTDCDIDYTLGNMSSAGVKVVRVWAFNGRPRWAHSSIPPQSLHSRCRDNSAQRNVFSVDCSKWYDPAQYRSQWLAEVGHHFPLRKKA